MLVRDLLAQKGNSIWTVSSQVTVREALRLMAEKQIGALVVVDSGTIAGLFSERDYARNVVAISNFSLNMPVERAMTRRVFYCIPEQTVDDCMALMTQRNIRHLPVVDEGILVGMISIGDVVKSTLAQMDSRIDDLEEYLRVHLI